jgi:hypothetical protein
MSDSARTSTAVRSFICGSVLLISNPAWPADCVSQVSHLAGVANFPQVREQVCSSDGSANAGDLKITFLRLGEAVAGSMARKAPIPELESILKGMTVAENEVFKELASIFGKFGHTQTYPADSVRLVLNIKAFSPGLDGNWKSVEIPTAPRPANSSQQFWTISAPFGNTPDGVAISMKAALDTILKTDSWPAGFKQFYICRSSEILCARNWTYLELGNLQTIGRDTAAADHAAGVLLDGSDKSGNGTPAAGDDGGNSSDWPSPQYQADIPLFRYLGAAGWPQEFLVANSGNDECGGDFYFNYHPRPLALDVAIIENSATAPANIVDIIGTRIAAAGLRRTTPQASPDQPAPLSQASATIPPKGRLVVPLRILFLDSIPDWRTPRRTAEAKAMYQKIRAKPPQSLATLTLGTERPRTIVKKKLASFAAPELPEEVEFVFGPEIVFRGLVLAKNPISLGNPSFDLLALDDSDLEHREEAPIVQLSPPRPGGSCPILYSFIDGEWVNHGKVIHEANGTENLHTSVVQVSPAARKFRVAEEEPEIATIKRVSLTLKLRDGSRITLDPEPRLDRTPSSEFKVPAYTKVDLEFMLPAEHADADIVGSEIAVTGFYQRYSSVAGR